MLQPLMEACHPEFSLGRRFWSTATPALLHCVCEKRVGAPTADGKLSSRILIGALRLEHCDTNIAALRS